MKKNILIIFTFLSLVSTTLFGQNKLNIAQPELDSGTIEQQFDYIITKSSKFKEFQLIRLSSILKVKAHALDSVKILRTKLNTINNSTEQFQATIHQLENDVKTLKTEIDAISENVDSITFLGAPLSKSAYNSIVWAIIILLSLIIIVFFIQLKKNSIVTKNSKNDFEKIEIELENFRKNALKKEQEIMRKLQDEINKNNP